MGAGATDAAAEAPEIANAAGATDATAEVPVVAAATAAKPPKQCKSCKGVGHSLQTYRGCINHGKPKQHWKKWDGYELPPPPPKQPKQKKEKWQSSKGKLLLRDSIIDGTVTRKLDPEEVHKSNPEWAKWPFNNFKTNLKNLFQAVALDYEQLAEDCQAFGHDLALLTEF